MIDQREGIVTLDVTALAERLRRFCDPEYNAFEGFPESRSSAAERWSDAFESYLSALEVIAPSTLTPTNGSATFGAIRSAFKNPLTFTAGFPADVGFATELSTAWQSGVDAILLVPGATQYLPAPSVSVVTSISPLSTGGPKSQLFSELLLLFRGPIISATDRCQQIAQALHTATSAAGNTTCTVSDTTTGAPVSLPNQPLVFG